VDARNPIFPGPAHESGDYNIPAGVGEEDIDMEELNPIERNAVYN
jgi:hypothetical protein